MATSKTNTASKTNSAAAKAAPAKTAMIKALEKACLVAEKAFERADQARNQALDTLADAFRVAGVNADALKGNAKTSEPRRVIKGFFDHLAEKGMLSKASAATYQTCFWIAFEKQVPFSPSLANAKTKEASSANVGKGKAKADAAKVKGSIVVTASRENLQSLLMQTIKMAKDLGLGTFATELVASGKGIDLLPKDFK